MRYLRAMVTLPIALVFCVTCGVLTAVALALEIALEELDG